MTPEVPPMLHRRAAGIFPLVAAVGTLCSGCVMQETVRDSSGNVIYKGPVRGTPYESEEKRSARLIEREDRLGY